MLRGAKLVVPLLAAFSATVPAFAQDGTLDPSFGDGTGYRLINYLLFTDSEDDYTGVGDYPSNLRARALVVQSDERILDAVGYHASHNDPGTIEITRTLADGGVDSSFTATPVQGPVILSSPASMALQASGKLVVLGQSFNNNANDFVVFRYGSTGSLDSGWGNNGRLDVSYTLVPNVSITPIDVLVQADDKIVLTGTATSNSGVSYFVALRLMKDGAIDTGYGVNSNGQVVVTRFGEVESAAPSEQLHHARLTAKGNLFLGGWTQPVHASSGFPPPVVSASIALAKLTSAGVLDTTFGNGGVVIYNTGLGDSLGATDIAPTRNESVYVVTSSAAVLRFLKNGSTDFTFAGGIATFTPTDPDTSLALTTFSRAIAVQQQDGKIVVAGEADRNNGENDAMAARLLVDGSPDPSFGTANSGTGVFLQNTGLGTVHWEEAGVIAQQNGQILLGGKVQHAVSNINYIPIIYRLKVDRIFADGYEVMP